MLSEWRIIAACGGGGAAAAEVGWDLELILISVHSVTQSLYIGDWMKCSEIYDNKREILKEVCLMKIWLPSKVRLDIFTYNFTNYLIRYGLYNPIMS